LILGPSGSGKSTLARALAGMVGPGHGSSLSGRLEVDDLTVGQAPQARLAERVGLVFQDPASQVVMERVEDDVAFGLENRAWPRQHMAERVPVALAEVGLAGFERRRSTRLSGGEQQRLALAGVLAPMPGLLVLDEPTANLDPGGAIGLMRRLQAIRASGQASLVVIEHRQELAWSLADRVLVLDAGGGQLDFGQPDDVLGRSGPRIAEEGIWLPEADHAGVARFAGTWGGFGPDATGTVAASLRPLVEAESLGFAYESGPRVLDGIGLSASAGERIALLGANGSGKSTLGRLLVGLLRPTEGQVELQGRAPHRLAARDLARRAGYAFQDPEEQFLKLRVDEEVTAGLTAAESGRVEGLMEALGLPLARFGERSPYTLSGGEQRRLSLACLLVREPPLLVLDEPTFGQDRRGYEGLLALLRGQVEAGAAVVLATHDLRLVRDLAPRAIALSAGRLEFDGPTQALLTDTPMLARLGLAEAA
jgi:energy-coupling factor transporter ATP-binding protein EcfA2